MERRRAPPVFEPVDHPVTGGVKTPITPMRGLLQPFCATGTKVMIPAFVGLTVRFTRPLPFEAAVTTEIVEPLMRILTPRIAFPCWLTLIVSVFLWPTSSCFGETASAVQYV